MHFINTPVKKRRRKCDLTRGNGGRKKPIIYNVGYKKHNKGNGYCMWIKGLFGWNPCGDGKPLSEAEVIKLGERTAKENKAEWVGEL